jgi:hypothetical protein
MRMEKLAHVSSRGQILILAEILTRLGRPRTILIREENHKIILEPILSFKDAFGSGGKYAEEIAIAISKDRREEAGTECLKS